MVVGVVVVVVAVVVNGVVVVGVVVVGAVVVVVVVVIVVVVVEVVVVGVVVVDVVVVGVVVGTAVTIRLAPVIPVAHGNAVTAKLIPTFEVVPARVVSDVEFETASVPFQCIKGTQAVAPGPDTTMFKLPLYGAGSLMPKSGCPAKAENEIGLNVRGTAKAVKSTEKLTLNAHSTVLMQRTVKTVLPGPSGDCSDTNCVVRKKLPGNEEFWNSSGPGDDWFEEINL